MKNFEVTDKNTGKKYWISRSIATMCVVVGKDSKTKEIKVLAERRGPGCPDNIGKLVVPCGYLDFDETLKEAAVREIYEETGLKLSVDDLTMTGINDAVSENRQNVTIRFMAVVPLIDLKVMMETNQINSNTKSRGGEEGEVSEVLLMTPEEIDKTTPDDWAFSHKRIINEVINMISEDDDAQ